MKYNNRKFMIIMKINKYINYTLMLIILLIIMSLCGCIRITVNQEYQYDDSKYNVGNKAFVDVIDAINIDWIMGNIFILKSENHELIIREEMRGETEQVEDIYKMHYYLNENNILDIRFAGSVKNLNYNYKIKTLYIFLPSAINHIKINNVSSDINITQVNIKNLKIDNVSGDIELNKFVSENFNCDTVSGDVSINQSKINNLDMNNVSGEIIIFDNEVNKVEIESVSGNIGITYINIPNELDIETVSANLTMYVFKDAKIGINYETMSGNFKSNLKYEYINEKYIFNNSEINFDIETVSGNLKINSK